MKPFVLYASYLDISYSNIAVGTALLSMIAEYWGVPIDLCEEQDYSYGTFAPSASGHTGPVFIDKPTLWRGQLHLPMMRDNNYILPLELEIFKQEQLKNYALVKEE